jgi:hypothetical protein
MAVLTDLGIFNATDRAAAQQVINQAGVLDYFPALVVGAGAYLATQVRGLVLGPLTEYLPRCALASPPRGGWVLPSRSGRYPVRPIPDYCRDQVPVTSLLVASALLYLFYQFPKY